MKQGSLVLKIYSANLRHDTEYFGKMDPYVLIKFGDQEQKTQVIEEGGKSPKWDQEFCFRASIGDKLIFQVMDDDNGKDDTIMTAEIMVRNTQNAEDMMLTGYYDGKNAGELMINMEYLRDGDAQEDDFQQFYEKQKKETEEKIEQWKIEQEARDQERIDNDPELHKMQEQIQQLSIEKEEITKKRTDVEVEVKEQLDKQESSNIEYKMLKEELEHNRQGLEMVKQKIDSIKKSGNNGTLIMQNFELRLKKDKGGFMDKMDPKVYIHSGEAHLELEEKTNAGTHALWKQQVQMQVKDAQVVSFQIYDVDVGSDQYLAHGSFTIFEISGKPREGFKVTLINKGQEDGTLQFDVAFQDINA